MNKQSWRTERNGSDGDSPNRTLIDGLVGILIAVIFMIAFVPALKNAISSTSKKTTMLSNLKQIATANMIYASDYDGKIVVAEGWIDRIMPYTKNEQLFVDVHLSPESRKNGSYGVALFKPLATVNSGLVRDPGSVPLVFQSSLLHRSASSELSTLPIPPRNGKTNTVAFLDGSARRVPPSWPETPTLLVIRPIRKEAK